ncbi:MAG: hypothetical protein ACRDY7_19005, partial [Acidimicrobiia bacterium]
MSLQPIDEDKLHQFMGGLVGHMTGAVACWGIWLGDELGLYRVMTGAGPVSAEVVAGKSGCNPRLVREWLDGQAAAGLVAYDPTADSYELGDAGRRIQPVPPGGRDTPQPHPRSPALT